jgi:hypothetical protein
MPEQKTCSGHGYLIERIERVEAKIGDFEDEISDLRETNAAGKVQITTLFNVIEEIKVMLREYTVEMKAALKTVSEDILKLKNRPADSAEKLKWIIATAAVTGVIGAVVGHIVR